MEAIIFAKEIGITSVILEAYSEVINSLWDIDDSFASFDHLIGDATNLQKTLSNIIFSHVQCQCNFVTHKFARHAKHVKGYSMWMNTVPPHLNTVILANMATFS